MTHQLFALISSVDDLQYIIKNIDMSCINESNYLLEYLLGAAFVISRDFGSTAFIYISFLKWSEQMYRFFNCFGSNASKQIFPKMNLEKI